MDAYLEALASFSTMNGYSSIPEECLKDLKVHIVLPIKNIKFAILVD